MSDLTPGDAQDLLERYKRASERLDVDAMVALFREDAEYRFDPFEPPLMGANAIRARWNELAARIAHVDFDAERSWLVGDTVLASFHAAWTDRATGERTRTRGFLTFELAPDGLVRRLRDWSRTKSVGTDATFRPEGTTTPMAS